MSGDVVPSTAETPDEPLAVRFLPASWSRFRSPLPTVRGMTVSVRSAGFLAFGHRPR